MNGGIGVIEMLKRTNILALVGGGKNPYFPLNQLIIWDDHQGKIISKLRFNDNIISVRLRNDKIIVLTRNKFYAFNMNNLCFGLSLGWSFPQGLHKFPLHWGQLYKNKLLVKSLEHFKHL